MLALALYRGAHKHAWRLFMKQPSTRLRASWIVALSSRQRARTSVACLRNVLELELIVRQPNGISAEQTGRSGGPAAAGCAQEGCCRSSEARQQPHVTMREAMPAMPSQLLASRRDPMPGQALARLQRINGHMIMLMMAPSQPPLKSRDSSRHVGCSGGRHLLQHCDSVWRCSRGQLKLACLVSVCHHPRVFSIP